MLNGLLPPGRLRRRKVFARNSVKTKGNRPVKLMTAGYVSPHAFAENCSGPPPMHNIYSDLASLGNNYSFATITI